MVAHVRMTKEVFVRIICFKLVASALCFETKKVSLTLFQYILWAFIVVSSKMEVILRVTCSAVGSRMGR